MLRDLWRRHHDSIIFGALLLLWLGVPGAWGQVPPATTQPDLLIKLPGGFEVDKHLSLGQLGIGLGLLVQIGRWGRKNMAKLAHLVALVEGVPSLGVPSLDSRLARIERRLNNLPCDAATASPSCHIGALP